MPILRRSQIFLRYNLRLSIPIPTIKKVRLMEEKSGSNKRRNQSNFVDRRSGEDRRDVYSLDYFSDGGEERRSGSDRRQGTERRSDCVKVSKWTSVCNTKP